MRPSFGPPPPPRGMMRSPPNLLRLSHHPLPPSLGSRSPRDILMRKSCHSHHSSRYLPRPSEGESRNKRGAEQPKDGLHQSPLISHQNSTPLTLPIRGAGRPKRISQHPRRGVLQNLRDSHHAMTGIHRHGLTAGPLPEQGSALKGKGRQRPAEPRPSRRPIQPSSPLKVF